MKPLLIARPEPGNAATAQAARSLGLTVIASPLLDCQEVEWNYDKSISYDALFITSANALRYAGDQLTTLRAWPVLAVGPASAEAARAAGFDSVITGNSDGAGLAAHAVQEGMTRVLHLAGDPHKPVAHPGLIIDVRIVYRTQALPPDPALITALQGPCVVLAHSPRLARALAALTPARDQIDLVAISAQTAEAAGTGWRSVSWPSHPDADAMLAQAAPLCRAA